MADETDSLLLAIRNATHHAIFFLDENGVITYWNVGAENIFGYRAEEIVGSSTAMIYTEEDLVHGMHAEEMDTALRLGYCEDDRWHIRKDGTRIWGSGIMTPMYDDAGAFQGFVKIARDKTPEKLANERALYLARHDPLTGLPNRSMFNDQLQSALSQAKLGQSLIQVLLLDLDRFKDINDSYVHHVGDLFLKQVAERLRKNVRSSDVVARLGGDEFGIICVTNDGDADMETLAEKLVIQLAAPYLVEDKEIVSGASIGITVYPLDGREPAQIMKNADLAMYAAKSEGRSAYRLYSEDLDADARRWKEIAVWLRNAIENNKLALHQLQYSLKDREVVCAEALLRWSADCPVSDLTAEEIVDIAAEIGMAQPLGEWILRTACNQAKEWRSQGIQNVRTAINVSSTQLHALPFLRVVDQVLRETGLPPECLDLEINEFVLMENNQANDLLFKSLKKKGVHISVDDFGTGFSSLSSLKTFPVDVLKIDQEFIKNLPQNNHDAAITSAIIGLAHSLNLKVAAEGIETREQAAFLESLGCDYGQGYFFQPPLPAEEVWRGRVESGAAG